MTKELEFSVKVEEVAAGLYDIICVHGEAPLLHHGIMPRWIFEILRKEMTEKLVRVLVEAGNDKEKARAYVTEEMIRQPVRDIVSEIFTIAKLKLQ